MFQLVCLALSQSFSFKTVPKSNIIQLGCLFLIQYAKTNQADKYDSQISLYFHYRSGDLAAAFIKINTFDKSKN